MKLEQIVEKIEFSFPSPFATGFDVKVHKNPSAPEMNLAKSRSSANELRGLLIGNAVYIWDANLALHTTVLDYLKVPTNVKVMTFIIDEDANLMPADYNTTEEQLWAVPMICRMMKF